MRILLVNKYATVTGGADLHCLELASYLAERGHEVALLSTLPHGHRPVRGAFVPASVTHSVRSSASPVKGAQIALTALLNRTAAAATQELIRQFRPDLVHIHKLYPQLSVAPVLVADRHGIPVVQTLHDYEFISASPTDHTGRPVDCDETHWSYRLLNSALFQVKRRLHVSRVSAWISVSPTLTDIYAARGIGPITLVNFTPPPADFPPSYTKRYGVLYVGRLSSEKGIPDLLAAAALQPGLPLSIGGSGPLQADVERSAKALPNVRYLGTLSRSEVQTQLRSARLLAMPSTWEEPGPLTALEAMAAGTPIVAYNTGGLADYVSAAQAGILVDHGAEHLAAAIALVDADPSLWARLSEGGYRAALSIHSPTRYLDALERIYRTLTA